MAWWQGLPSLTPIRGVIRFFYVWAHWQTISDDLKRRDERPREVERVMRQILRLEKDSHEAEKRELEEFYKSSLAERSEDFAEAVLALSIMLYVEDVPGIRDDTLERVGPRLRGILIRMHEHFQEIAPRQPPPELPDSS